MNKAKEKIMISSQTIGLGIYQFEHQIDRDHYTWHYYESNVPGNSYSCHWSDTEGAWLRLRFEGTSVSLYGCRGPQMGLAAFCLDGLSEELCDCNAESTEISSRLFHASNLTPGFHDLTIRVCGSTSRTKPVSISYVEVHSSFMEAMSIAHTPMCSPHMHSEGNDAMYQPQFSSDSLLNNAIVQTKPLAIEVSDNAPSCSLVHFYFSSEWELLSLCENLYLADAHICKAAGATASLSFFGSQLELYGAKGPEHGEVYIRIDALPGLKIDCFAPTPSTHALLYRSPVLDEGEHRINLTVTGCHNPLSTDSMILIDRASILIAAPPAAVTSIDPKRQFQTIENFGVSSGWTIDPICSQWSEEKKNELADLLYSREKGIGLSCFRFDLGAGSRISDQERINGNSWWRATDCFQASEGAPFSWNNQIGQQWMMRAAKQRDVFQYIAYVHSPPFWLTKNGHTQCDSDTGTTNLLAGKEKHFAQYLAEILYQFRQAGLPFDYISPINECGWKWEFPGVHEEGCRMDNHDMRSVLLAVAKELARRRLPEKILGPEAETIDALAKNIDYFMGDSELKDILSDCVTAHSYFTDLFEAMGIANRKKLAEKIKKYPSLQYWQTEYCFMGIGRGETRDYGITPALWLAKTIHYDLVLLDASAWQWWLSVSPGDFIWKDGLIYTDWKQPGDEENIIPSKMLWAFGNFSRFIRPKAIRLSLTGLEASDELLCSAFLNADGSLVSVWINCSCFNRPVQTDRSHQPACRSQVYLTDAHPEHNLTLADNLLASDNLLRLPARSIVTVITQP